MRPKQGSWDHTFWSHGGDDQKITRVRDLFALFLISQSPDGKAVVSGARPQLPWPALPSCVLLRIICARRRRRRRRR